MSLSTSVTKIIFDPSHLKTPNTKELSSSTEPNGDEIYMDEYGQTPDHFYLARKKPPTFFQVKRKLNLQSTTPSSEDGAKQKTSKRRRTNINPKAKKASTTRYDTSLGQLTKKFLKLLADATDGVINLNTACSVLSVPKRRLYDVSNVLEGVGLIEKTARNNIKYTGRSTSASSTVLYHLENEIDILEAKENKLDELIYNMNSQIKAFKEFEGEYLYVSSNDLNNVKEFSQKTLIGVNIGSGEQVIKSDNRLLLSSKTTELAAFLVDDSVVDILHPRAEFKENSYKVQICNNRLAGLVKEELEESNYVGYESDSTFAQLCSDNAWNEGFINGSSYASGSGWSEGHLIKDAFITDEDDIAPLSNFQLQTEDQDLDLPFPNLELEDNYSFSLDAGEGLSDLFDCNFSCP